MNEWRGVWEPFIKGSQNNRKISYEYFQNSNQNFCQRKFLSLLCWNVWLAFVGNLESFFSKFFGFDKEYEPFLTFTNALAYHILVIIIILS
jgi:hypothetical protein